MNDEQIGPRVAAEHISEFLGIPSRSVSSVLNLLGEGATIPFIARYRKEQTGGLDEVLLRAVHDEYQRWTVLEKRRNAILDGLRHREELTPELEQEIRAAENLHVLEDLYLPYRPRRRTRADIARSMGLDQPAGEVMNNSSRGLEEILLYYSKNLGLSAEQCSSGIADIVAADCAAHKDLRGRLRDLFHRHAAVESLRGKKPDDAQTYRDYLSWREPARSCPSHRLLAILRGEAAGVLRVSVRPPHPAALRIVQDFLYERAAAGDGPRRRFLEQVASDAYTRLLGPAMETELRREMRERAEVEAASVFAANLHDLLMAAPLGPKAVLAIDPGFRTGSKVVALDGTGRVRDHRTVFPVPPKPKPEEAAGHLREMVKVVRPLAVAVGNGTAGREVENFVRSLQLKDDEGNNLPIVMVNEAGASVYSASTEAREELPDLDVSIRGAVSIGRRLQDPLSELVKIDPAAVGVGQYQHDINPSRLETALERTVESCVNAVGVELNTAGRALLARVAGLGPGLSASLVAWRDERGKFPTRTAILKVPGIGPRTAEQAMGFLRCSDAIDPLDNTGVHPERYHLVERMASDLGCTTADLCGNVELVDRIDPTRYVESGEEGPGLPTVQDILRELRLPGRDPRESFSPPTFREDVNTIEDLSDGMELAGIVTNVTGFGAFVDIGVHRDGLIHISRLSDRFVRDPREIVRAGQHVDVVVLSVDRSRGRIDLQRRESGHSRDDRD